MTVINPNSVAGINSITVQSGNALSVHKSDGTLIRTITESSGISTFTSVSVGSATTDNSANNSINDGDLQGRPYVGAAGSFQGLYIGNGMVVNDNQLNGDHYIGTAFGGMMAGPVTVNGVLTVDGNYVVV